MLTRRSFIQSMTAAGLAGATLGAPAIVRAAGPVWGTVPNGVWSSGTAPSPNIKMLEIHLLGGTAPYESFYYRPTLASGRTRGFDAEVSALNWNGVCPNTPSGLVHQALGNNAMLSRDENNKDVHLGPFAKPFWPVHISSRMRVVALAHDLVPHEVAIPYVMTGSKIGRPNQSTLGAAIQERYRVLDIENGNPFRAAPYAYGLLPENTFFDQLAFNTLGTVGMHHGSAKPLVMRVGPQFSTFISQLTRPISNSSDALLDQYRAQYRDWLRYQGQAAPNFLTRSKAFSDYDAAVANLFDSGSLSSLLVPAPSTVASAASCAAENGVFENNLNATATALKTAVYLLTRPSAQQARYVHVVDGGIVRQGLPYDVHSTRHVTDTGSNLWSTLSTLAGMIRDPANPQPNDADKLDLNETIIVINTEFGRTPFKSLGTVPNAGSLGRDHWPQAFCSVVIGGPITTAGVVGSIMDGSSTATVADIPYTPTDLRAALLLAMNIDPFETENFALGSLSAPFSTAMDHTAAMVLLRQKILGIV